MSTFEEDLCRVLSIQSHVVHGYVGNKSAVFPLQILGFEVDYLNSVQLSNHTGYSHVKGQVLNADDLDQLVSGLNLNGINQYSHLLTGYVGTVSFLEKVVDVMKQLKAVNPQMTYVCDPVMGDDGLWYVPEELLPVYRDKVVPMADIITPNQFEAELLSGVSIKTEEDILQAADVLHNKGTRTVIITSSEIGSKGVLTGVGSMRKDGRNIVVKFEIPKLDGHFTGAGDLFAAVFLAWMHKTNSDLKVSCEKSSSTVYHVLKRTLDKGLRKCDKGQTPSAYQMELDLIRAKFDIENPKVIFSAAILRE